MNRRAFLGTAGAVGALSLAGCSDLNPLSEGPDDVVESYIEESAELAQDGGPLADYQHSATQDEETEFELIEVETEVIETALSEEELQDRTFGLDDDEISDIVENEETAVVEATMVYEQDGEETEEVGEFVLATDDGDWKILNEG